MTGYYTLSNASVSKSLFSNAARRELIYPVTSATLIGRLAVRKELQGSGQRFGADLLQRALTRCVNLSRQSGSAVILVDTIDDRARRFYSKAGFKAFPVRPVEETAAREPAQEYTQVQFWISMKAAAKALGL
ncbi:MAG: GCN5-related N-acetyltransferase [Gammaproteobacteria bacterium]|nr:GCN5-related N-acetyltransferase [Gammaproteobacteria bacterium]